MEGTSPRKVTQALTIAVETSFINVIKIYDHVNILKPWLRVLEEANVQEGTQSLNSSGSQLLHLWMWDRWKWMNSLQSFIPKCIVLSRVTYSSHIQTKYILISFIPKRKHWQKNHIDLNIYFFIGNENWNSDFCLSWAHLVKNIIFVLENAKAY